MLTRVFAYQPHLFSITKSRNLLCALYRKLKLHYCHISFSTLSKIPQRGCHLKKQENQLNRKANEPRPRRQHKKG